MKITLKQLSRYEKPCAAGVEWLAQQKNCDLSALAGTAIENEPFIYKDKTWYPLDFALWALPQLMDKQEAVLYAVYAARLVLKPSDIISVEAIELAEAWLKNPCEETRRAARAAEAAGAAGAAWAARAEAGAAWAARAEAGAAWAAKYNMAVKIVRYGVKILDKKIRVCN